MNILTQRAKKRQRIIEYSLKYGKSKASRKYKEPSSNIKRWSKKGYCFSFRVCCSETNEAQCFATLKWLYDMGCKGTFIPPTKEEDPEWWTRKVGWDSQETFNRIVGDSYHRYWEPDYGDPLFLKYLDLFLENFAQKYDNDDRVEFIDLGSYGNWGEGHVCFGTRKSASIETLKQHAYLHAKHFKNKFILHIHAPADIEFGHYWSYTHDDAKDGIVIIEVARRAHATYAGFHTYPEDYLRDNYYVVEYLANRLGYWYTIHSATANDTVCAGCPMLLEIQWENMGFAPAYTRFELEIRLKSESGDEIFIKDTKFDNTIFQPGMKYTVRSYINLPEDMPRGKYDVALRLF